MARDLSPDLNPLSAYINDDTIGKASDEDVDDLLPAQIPSIINEDAVVRFYKDGTKRPIIVSEGLQGTATVLELVQGEHFDVLLALDVTTGCGGKIWPAAEVLGEYIASKRSDGQWRNKVAVELGAGTGLVGFLAAAATNLSKVYVTDQM
jgi:hypothetical protein